MRMRIENPLDFKSLLTDIGKDFVGAECTGSSRFFVKIENGINDRTVFRLQNRNDILNGRGVFFEKPFHDRLRNIHKSSPHVKMFYKSTDRIRTKLTDGSSSIPELRMTVT